jgi:hypothetical protein
MKTTHAFFACCGVLFALSSVRPEITLYADATGNGARSPARRQSDVCMFCRPGVRRLPVSRPSLLAGPARFGLER